MLSERQSDRKHIFLLSPTELLFGVFGRTDTGVVPLVARCVRSCVDAARSLFSLLNSDLVLDIKRFLDTLSVFIFPPL